MLKRQGVPQDGVLMVHSAFRAMGREGFSPESTVEALAEYMAPGTLVLPTMSWRYVKPHLPTFDELATPSNNGVLTEIFRQRYATHRSLHPTHSAAAMGTHAAAITAEHHLDDTPCSARSPFGKLVELDAWVVMMGISMDCCTLAHHAEELVAPDVYLKPVADTELYDCRRRDGQTIPVRLRRHLFLPRDYFQFQDALAERGRLGVDLVGSTVCRVYRAKDMVDTCLGMLYESPEVAIARAGGRYRMM